jgi:hypothetical protein
MGRGSVDHDGQGDEVRRCVKFGKKECLKGKALMRGMGLRTGRLVASTKYAWRGEEEMFGKCRLDSIRWLAWHTPIVPPPSFAPSRVLLKSS